jgi:predicted O-methyltransferase YrrM
MSKPADFLRRLATIGLRRPSDLRHIFGVANATAAAIEDPVADVRDFPLVPIEEIAASARFTFHVFPGTHASITLAEAGALAALMHRVSARRVFEFGTYQGVSTTQIALNLPPDGMVFTLDLPAEVEAGALRVEKAVEREIAAEARKGTLVPDELRGKITFLEADSAKFDTAPYAGTMDLVFVDGAHSREYVRNDTAKALELLRPGGCVAWHDCAPNHPEVVAVLKESGLPVSLVHGTALAFAMKGKK